MKKFDGNKYFEKLSDVIPYNNYNIDSMIINFECDEYCISIFYEIYAEVDRITIKFIKQNQLFYIDHTMRDDITSNHYHSPNKISIDNQVEYLINNYKNITDFNWINAINNQ